MTAMSNLSIVIMAANVRHQLSPSTACASTTLPERARTSHISVEHRRLQRRKIAAYYQPQIRPTRC